MNGGVTAVRVLSRSKLRNDGPSDKIPIRSPQFLFAKLVLPRSADAAEHNLVPGQLRVRPSLNVADGLLKVADTTDTVDCRLRDCDDAVGCTEDRKEQFPQRRGAVE